jgi:two-component system nitrate/nitrite response regulator NarL
VSAVGPISLYVLDDHALFREGLLRLLEHDPTIRVAGSAGAIPAALADLARLAVDVLILDYDLGDDTALTVVRALQARGSPTRVVLVTAGLPTQDALELIRLGIFGIFHKQQAPDELLRTIHGVAEGKVLIDQQYLQRLVAATVRPAAERPRLTERDRQVLRHLLEGLSNKEIAAQLGVSEGAIKASLQQLFAKTGVRTRSHLVRVALEKLRDEL